MFCLFWDSFLAAVVALPARAQAQAPPHLSELLPDLILREVTLPRPGGRRDFARGALQSDRRQRARNPAVGIVRSFNKLTMVQLSTQPLGSPAGGFTYTFDESLGTFRRTSSSFGPSFAERALTLGRNKFNGGFTYQRTRYTSFEGRDLGDGSIKFYLRHSECCSPGSGGGSGGGGGGQGGGGGPIEQPNGSRLSPPFEGDVIEAALSLDATVQTAAFSFSYGVTNRWDVGVVVPVVRLDLSADVQATIVRLATASDPLTHTFETGNAGATTKTFHESGSATGLGDVVLRTKYRVASFGNGGLAGAADVRLPTGDRNDLLGSGGQAKLFLVHSAGTSRVMEHVNVGYTAAWGAVPNVGVLVAAWGGGTVPDEFTYAAGLEFVAEPRPHDCRRRRSAARSAAPGGSRSRASPSSIRGARARRRSTSRSSSLVRAT